MPVSAEDAARLNIWTSAAEQHIKDIAARQPGASHHLLWGSLMKVKEARLHIETFLMRNDDPSPPSEFQRSENIGGRK